MATLASILQPDGAAIGRATEDPTIRALDGGDTAAAAMFATLAEGAAVTTSKLATITARHPDGSTITFILTDRAGTTAIEIESRDTFVRRLEYSGGMGKRDGGMDG